MQSAAVSTTAENHVRAICNEIGERLRYTLRIDASLPPRLQALLNQLAELDCEAPPLVPALQQIEHQGYTLVAHAA